MNSVTHHTADDVWRALRDVKDPEIPVLSLVDLNVIRDVTVEDSAVKVRMVPTFAGCPAMDLMRQEVERKLTEMGFEQVNVQVDRTASWSTENLAREAAEKLRAFGIAPPPRKTESLAETLSKPVPCPFCQSLDTQPDGDFGSTLCKQYYLCRSCKQSFERFKPL